MRTYCIALYTVLPTVYSREPYSMLCIDPTRKEIQKWEDICMCSGFTCSTAETNTTLGSNHAAVG